MPIWRWRRIRINGIDDKCFSGRETHTKKQIGTENKQPLESKIACIQFRCLSLAHLSHADDKHERERKSEAGAFRPICEFSSPSSNKIDTFLLSCDTFKQIKCKYRTQFFMVKVLVAYLIIFAPRQRNIPCPKQTISAIYIMSFLRCATQSTRWLFINIFSFFALFKHHDVFWLRMLCAITYLPVFCASHAKCQCDGSVDALDGNVKCRICMSGRLIINNCGIHYVRRAYWASIILSTARRRISRQSTLCECLQNENCRK